MKCLISGPSERIQDLLNQYPAWKLFQWNEEESEANESDSDTETEFGNLFGQKKN